MKRITKLAMVLLFTALVLASNIAPTYAKSVGDKITPRTVVAGALSLLIWPGIGQAINDNKGEKVATHAVLGLLPPYRVWSCYDAVVDRKGGYWKGRI